METISLGGHIVPGFALGAPSTPSNDGGGTVALASMMTGATAGLLAYVVKAPVWGAVLAGAGAALLTKVGIDRAAA